MKRRQGFIRVLLGNKGEKGRQTLRNSLVGSPDTDGVKEPSHSKERKYLQRDGCGRGQNRQGVRRRTAP